MEDSKVKGLGGRRGASDERKAKTEYKRLVVYRGADHFFPRLLAVVIC